jgi:DNA-binding MarR family transcriptional regulator
MPSPEDGRSMLVALTSEGRRRVEEAFRADMASEAEFLAEMPPDKREALAGLLRELNLAVERRLSKD